MCVDVLGAEERAQDAFGELWRYSHDQVNAAQ